MKLIWEAAAIIAGISSLWLIFKKLEIYKLWICINIASNWAIAINMKIFMSVELMSFLKI
jgi:nicotinamide riboside transporter PnuC